MMLTYLEGHFHKYDITSNDFEAPKMDNVEKKHDDRQIGDLLVVAEETDTSREPRVATNLRNLRQSREMTAEQLADKAEVEDEYIHYLEDGERGVSVSLLFKLAAALNVDVREFFRPLENEQNG